MVNPAHIESACRVSRNVRPRRPSGEATLAPILLRPVISEESSMDIVRLIFAILLPPVGVFLQVGFGGHFWLNILLTLLGYVPGIVHAVWIIARR